MRHKSKILHNNDMLQVEDITKVAKERVELAKALIRAHERPKGGNKRNSKDGGKDDKSGTDEKTSANTNSTEAA